MFARLPIETKVGSRTVNTRPVTRTAANIPASRKRARRSVTVFSRDGGGGTPGVSDCSSESSPSRGFTDPAIDRPHKTKSGRQFTHTANGRWDVEGEERVPAQVTHILGRDSERVNRKHYRLQSRA